MLEEEETEELFQEEGTREVARAGWLWERAGGKSRARSGGTPCFAAGQDSSTVIQ